MNLSNTKVYRHLAVIQTQLDLLIMATPTGEIRNKLTELNIAAMSLMKDMNVTEADKSWERQP
jgi:hypothetical protein